MNLAIAVTFGAIGAMLVQQKWITRELDFGGLLAAGAAAMLAKHWGFDEFVDRRRRDDYISRYVDGGILRTADALENAIAAITQNHFTSRKIADAALEQDKRAFEGLELRLKTEFPVVPAAHYQVGRMFGEPFFRALVRVTVVMTDLHNRSLVNCDYVRELLTPAQGQGGRSSIKAP